MTTILQQMTKQSSSNCLTAQHAYWQGMAMKLASRGINPEEMLKEAQMWENLKDWWTNTGQPAMQGAWGGIKDWAQNVPWGEMLKRLGPYMAAGGLTGMVGSRMLRPGAGMGAHLGAGALGAVAPALGSGLWGAGRAAWQGAQPVLNPVGPPAPPSPSAISNLPHPQETEDSTALAMRSRQAAQQREDRKAQSISQRQYDSMAPIYKPAYVTGFAVKLAQLLPGFGSTSPAGGQLSAPLTPLANRADPLDTLMKGSKKAKLPAKTPGTAGDYSPVGPGY